MLTYPESHVPPNGLCSLCSRIHQVAKFPPAAEDFATEKALAGVESGELE